MSYRRRSLSGEAAVRRRTDVTLRLTLDGAGSVAEIRSGLGGLMAVGNGLAASDAFIEATADASSLVMYGGMALPAVAQPSPPLLLDLPPAPWAEGAVRVGDGVRAPFKIRNVPPTYPAEALSARLQGVVILEALSLP